MGEIQDRFRLHHFLHDVQSASRIAKIRAGCGRDSGKRMRAGGSAGRRFICTNVQMIRSRQQIEPLCPHGAAPVRAAFVPDK
jgi:hypothetical protein